MGFFKKLVRVFSGLQINSKQPLNGYQLDHVLVSSMYASQQSAYLNAYTTGLDKSEIAKLLEDYWNVYNAKDAIETIDSLLERNDDPNMELVYQAYNKENYFQILKAGLSLDEKTFQNYVQTCKRLIKIAPEFIKEGLFENATVLETAKDAGWNFGRASFIARCSFDMGYLSEKELIQCLETSYNGLKKHCKTWKEYTTSYVYGRALWGGTHNDGMIAIAEDLFTNKKSPLKDKTSI